MEMADKGNRPSAAPESIENSSVDDRQEYLQSVVSSVVQNVWHYRETKSLKTDDQTEPEKFCCGEDIEEEVILCGAGRNCTKGEVFHYSCAGLDTENLPNNWFCSDTCRNEKDSYPYCTCHQDLGNDEPMIGCSAGSKCTADEWYHTKCLDMTDVPEGKCRDITWTGLNLLCRRDAVREADGEAMISHWKLDLVHFFSTKHPKYVILAHRLLVSINGWLPDKLKHDLIYNRTVNYGGGIGRNLPMDFMNEILNILFKDLLDSAKGRYTNNTIQRCSQIVGPLGEALDSVFDSKVIENELYRHRRRNLDRDLNVSKMITFLGDESLFSQTPGRHHRAFPKYFHNENPKFPGKFQGKMKQLSKRLDKRRRIIACIVNA
ncbi:unnamed protein product [Mytilus edulis]|uniref:DUF6589 domain-containing protein n=2 Tax=Mytilus TaxID=6548 RepID=A0A8S3QD74_MYTED|nr:unnamed protein product [Mytilus edulis]